MNRFANKRFLTAKLQRLWNIQSKRFFILLGLLLLVVIGIISALRVLTIQHIQVTGMDAAITIDPALWPMNILIFPIESVEEVILKEYPQIKHITIEKQFPSTIFVHLVPRVPIARLTVNNRSVLVDQDGVIFAEWAGESYPEITAQGVSLRIGRTIDDKKVMTSLAFLAQIAQDEDILSVFVEDRMLRVTMKESTVFVSKDRDGGESARTLQSLIQGFRIKGSQPKTIDIRFDQPVVTW